MTNILVILAAIVWLISIVVSLVTDNSWKSVGLSWGILALGGLFLVIAFGI